MSALDIIDRLELLARGDNLDLADIVCADAISEIKKLRRSLDPPIALPFDEETRVGLNSLTIRKSEDDQRLIQLLKEMATEFAIDNKTDCKQHVCWIAAGRLTALLAGVQRSQRRGSEP